MRFITRQTKKQSQMSDWLRGKSPDRTPLRIQISKQHVYNTSVHPMLPGCGDGCELRLQLAPESEASKMQQNS